jgi:mRNA interferase HigB
MGSDYNSTMRIISRKTLKEFWDQHPEARQPLKAWYSDTKQAVWKTPADIKKVYRNVSFITNNRIVFNIKGNKYRLIVSIQYHYSIVYIRFVGTHREYGRINAATI